MAQSHEPQVFIVSGPSGSGKSTLVIKLLEVPSTMFSVSATTRPPRATERPGEWYNFVSEAEFQRMIDAGEFLEYACVFGKHKYGTPRRWFEEARKKGLDLVLEIDVQGAEQVKKKIPSAILIFILPPSRQELEGRIRARGTDSDEEIRRRLDRARQEMQKFTEYDYIVINDDLERAGREVQAIASAARSRSARNGRRVKKILDSFRG
ncbi:MAG: guanylate kinase [Acidobacteria bacterium]|nr:guanylate kinase [Acidobacteriota bacterium]